MHTVVKAVPLVHQQGSVRSTNLGLGCLKRLNKSGVLEEVDEHLIDKLVLGYGLDHKHSLLPQVSQHHVDIDFLQRKGGKKKKGIRM